MTDLVTQRKWDKAAAHFDFMAAKGAERRWLPHKQKLFANMHGKVLFLALGTGLDIAAFPSDQNITAIDISPKAFVGFVHTSHQMTVVARHSCQTFYTFQHPWQAALPPSLHRCWRMVLGNFFIL